MRRLTRGTIREARNILTLTRARASGGGAGGVAMPQPTAQNQMIISNATPAWMLLAAPTAQYQVPIAGADPYTPAWAALTIGAISDLAYATPALTLSTSNIEGSADTVIRSDATVLVFDATAPNVIQPDDAAAAGSASIAARRDHEHGIVCAAPVATGTANAEGSATSFPRSDHVHLLHVHDHSGNAGDGGQLDWDLIWSDAVHDHTSDAEGGVLDLSAISDLDYAVPALTLSTGNAEGAADTVIRSDATILIFDATVPDVIQPDDAAAAGSAAVAARRDHTHGIVCVAPASPSVSVDASAEGSGTSFARADHTHQLDQAIVPTWTGLHTFNIGIKFGGVLAANTITAPDNAILAVRLIDAGNIEYLRVVSTDTQPAVVFNDGGADVDHRWEASGQANALFIRGSDGKIGIWASTLNARVEIGGTPGPAMLNLPTNLSTIDAGLSSRNIADECIIAFGANIRATYTGRTVTAEAGACIRCDTRDQDTGYTIFHVITRAAGAAESAYTIPFKIAGGAPTDSLFVARDGKVGIGIVPVYNFQVHENSDAGVAMAAFLNPGATTAGRETYILLGKSTASGGAAALGLFSDTGTPANARVVLGHWGDSEATEYLNILKDGRASLGTATPAASALLDLTSTARALLLTRMTTTQRDALTAANGMVLYNTTTTRLEAYENGAWVDL